MSKYSCNGCPEHHTVNSKKCPNHCLMTGAANLHDWVEEEYKVFPFTLASLKAEKVDIPPWANWCLLAAPNRIVFGAKHPKVEGKTYIFEDGVIQGYCVDFVFEGPVNQYFSLPKHPAPSWQKCGQLVRFENHVGRIDLTANDGSTFSVNFFDGYKGCFEKSAVVPVKIIPWNFDNARVYFKTKDDLFSMIHNSAKGWGYKSSHTGKFWTMQEVSTGQIDKFGQPCGIIADLPLVDEIEPEDEEDFEL